MMALGAQLVGDDQVDMFVQNDQVMANAVAPIKGLIEARGIGLLRAASVGPVPLAYIVDLDQTVSARLPEPFDVYVLKRAVPLLRGAGVPNLAAGLMQLVRMGRVAPEWPNS